MNTYQITDGWANMDIPAIHQFLSSESYWAKGIPLETVTTSLKNSYCVGVYDEYQQVGFARLITDYATFAYLADVYVLSEHRGKGLSKRMMQYIADQPWTKGLRRIMLATSDAHELYKQYGFEAPKDPGTLMEIKRNNIYAK